MICKVCSNNVDKINGMGVCDKCDEIIKKRIIIKNSQLNANVKKKMLNEIEYYSLKDIQDIIELDKNNKEIVINKKNSNMLYETNNVFDKFDANIKYDRYIWIDNRHKLWCPNPKVGFDGFLKERKNNIYSFRDIDYYEVQENETILHSSTKGGLGSSIAGGLLFGGVGAIVGSNIGKRKTVSRGDSTYIVFIYLKRSDNPTISIKCDTSIETAKRIAGYLNQIINQIKEEKSQQKIIEDRKTNNNKISIADKILKYKNLLDS